MGFWPEALVRGRAGSLRGVRSTAAAHRARQRFNNPLSPAPGAALIAATSAAVGHLLPVTARGQAPHASAGNRRKRASQTSAAASRLIGSRVPRFIAVQPPVVTKAPDENEVTVMVA